jgi:hypothetical protein
MANIQIGTAAGTTLGNPPSGDFYIFIDSDNSNAYTLRDNTGADTILGGAAASSYFKAEVLITSGSISASSSDQAVPSLTYTIPTGKDGNYIIYAILSVDIAGSDMKPFSIMLFKNGVKETNSVTMDFAKKNENQSVQLTFAMDGLVATDVLAVYINNDNLSVNSIISGRILAQKFT